MALGETQGDDLGQNIAWSSAYAEWIMQIGSELRIAFNIGGVREACDGLGP